MISEKIKNKLLAMILGENYSAGTKLPPIRELASVFGVDKMTIQKVVAELKKDGIIESHPGRGIFVNRLGGIAKNNSKKIVLVSPFSEKRLNHAPIYPGIVVSALKEELKKSGYSLELFSLPNKMKEFIILSSLKEMNPAGIVCFELESDYLIFRRI